MRCSVRGAMRKKGFTSAGRQRWLCPDCRFSGVRERGAGVFSQVGVSVFVRYFFRFWAWVCRPGVFYWFWGLPNMSAWLMRWLCPVNSMSRPWWTMRSMIEAASLSSAKIVPHSPGLDVRGGG